MQREVEDSLNEASRRPAAHELRSIIDSAKNQTVGSTNVVLAAGDMFVAATTLLRSGTASSSKDATRAAASRELKFIPLDSHLQSIATLLMEPCWKSLPYTPEMTSLRKTLAIVTAMRCALLYGDWDALKNIRTIGARYQVRYRESNLGMARVVGLGNCADERTRLG